MPEALLRLYIDADVLFAGAARSSETAASYALLLLGEIGLIEAVCAAQAVEEAERSLETKAPLALPAFRRIVGRCIQVLPDPSPAAVREWRGRADPEDLSHLVTAINAGCRWLVTFNERDYRPGHPDLTVIAPGRMIQRLRAQLAALPPSTSPQP
jgi:hypothetical protein